MTVACDPGFKVDAILIQPVVDDSTNTAHTIANLKGKGFSTSYTSGTDTVTAAIK
jgi:hypothetical protein